MLRKSEASHSSLQYIAACKMYTLSTHGQCELSIRLSHTETALRTFADSTIFALDCRVQKQTLRPFACEMAISTCKIAVQNSHHRLKQSRLCETANAV